MHRKSLNNCNINTFGSYVKFCSINSAGAFIFSCVLFTTYIGRYILYSFVERLKYSSKYAKINYKSRDEPVQYLLCFFTKDANVLLLFCEKHDGTEFHLCCAFIAEI